MNGVPLQGSTEFHLVTFNNDGLVDAQGGTLRFTNYTQTTGETRLSGGSISGSTLDIQGGLLSGDGHIYASVVNRGQVTPALSPVPIGVIQVHGNYVQPGTADADGPYAVDEGGNVELVGSVSGLAGALDVEIGEGVEGAAYDQLSITGTVTLAGTVNIHLADGFVPTIGEELVILNNDGTDKIVGVFAGLPESAVFTVGSSKFQMTYEGGADTNDVILTVVDPATPSQDGDTLTYEWDLDGDGVFGEMGATAERGDEIGLRPTFSAVGLDGPSARTVSFRISGPSSEVSTDTIDITVNNAPPSADAGGPYAVPVGQSIALTASATDPAGLLDPLTFQWDLDNDGIYGETGVDAVRGDEVGPAPTFSASGLAGLSSVTVGLQVRDDDGGLAEDTATINVIYTPDLSISSSDIAFSLLNPEPGQNVTISASVTNLAFDPASDVLVRFFAFNQPIGESTISSIGPGATAEVSLATSFSEVGLKLITVKIDPENAIPEVNEANNEASLVLQVGEAPIGDATIVVQASATTGYPGRPAWVSGRADYNFISVPGEQDYPVQGGQVTVRVVDPVTLDVLGVFTGSHTDVNGNFSQAILAPVSLGSYTLLIEVTDNTTSTQIQSTLNVVEPPPESPPSLPGPPSPVSRPGRDVFVHSENIFFTDDNPQLGEPITIFAYVQYYGAEAVDDLPVTVNDIFPVAGRLQTFSIGTTLVDFAASPETSTFVTMSMPWMNTADGAHIIQVAADPAFTQNTGNDQATRLIYVGTPADFLDLSKSFTLLEDADGNSIPTPGDTLRYTIDFDNTSTNGLTGAVLMDHFDTALLEVPYNISDGGTLSAGSITWDVGAIAGTESGYVTYDVQIKPPAEFPGAIVNLVNTAVLDTDQTPPVGAELEIEVIGDNIAPTTTAVVTPEPNAAGWNNTDDVQLVLTAVDNTDGSGVSHIVYWIDGGDETTVPGNSASVPFAQEGDYTVHFYAVDVAGNEEANEETPAQSIQIKIDQTPPVPVHAGPFFVDEGSTILLDGTSSWDDRSGIQETAWCLEGDGQFDDGDPAEFNAIDGPSTHPVALRVIDVAGNVFIDPTEVQVLNVAPTITGLTATVDPMEVGNPVEAHVEFTDPGLVDAHTITWDWGDGSDPTSQAIPEGARSADATYSYSSAGVYTITVTVNDGEATDSSVFNWLYWVSSGWIECTYVYTPTRRRPEIPKFRLVLGSRPP